MMVITRCSVHPSAPTRCGGCHGVALRTGRYPTRRSVVAPRDEVKPPDAVACEARRLAGTHHQAGETAHSCVAEASRSPSPSVSDADVWVSKAQRGWQARLLEGDRAVGSFGRAGQDAHSTVVHGSAMAHAAEAAPRRLPGYHRLAHERS